MKYEVSNVANLPTIYGNFLAKSFREFRNDGKILEHLVVYKNLRANPLVRIHSECLTGDVFASRKCDCGDELAMAMKMIADSANGGMLIYLRQEGRGIGLFNKINAYNLQDDGLDTVEANEKLGFESDMRDYDIVGEIFKHFDMKNITLLTNNPKKIHALESYANITRQSILATPNECNKHYLEVKKQKMGHLL